MKPQFNINDKHEEHEEHGWQSKPSVGANTTAPGSKSQISTGSK